MINQLFYGVGSLLLIVIRLIGLGFIYLLFTILMMNHNSKVDYFRIYTLIGIVCILLLMFILA